MSVAPTAASGAELAGLLAESDCWYVDEKAASELSAIDVKSGEGRDGEGERRDEEGGGRKADLLPLPILENIATKQAQIAWNRVSLNDSLSEAYPYQSVTPLYLRNPSITLKKTAPENPHGN